MASSNPSNTPDKLDEILDSYARYQYQLYVDNDGTRELNKSEAKKAINDCIREIIGENEPVNDIEATVDQGDWERTVLGPEVRNDLREQQRQRLEGHNG